MWKGKGWVTEVDREGGEGAGEGERKLEKEIKRGGVNGKEKEKHDDV